ncbi:hypothetical protein [Phenylobacterium sp.]|uniref:hypothetical protein n=1 Tax=Phenylobacterium sp. TaxID=1871053 RepID=UPI0027314A71|nr:hypothetical protein [Phenylobacterium sp.]MDP1874815.1 hypothetical protein [Phenylobacterium sp.]
MNRREGWEADFVSGRLARALQPGLLGRLPMRIVISAIALLALGVSSGADAAPIFTDMYRVRVVAGHYTGLYESVALRKVASSGGPFWMAERRKRTTAGITGPTVQIERHWIDGRQCPALAMVVESIAAIPQPKTSASIPPFHGARVYLGSNEADSGYAVRSDYEGPITAWWRQAEETLKPCWGTPIFTSDGERLPLTLELDTDEEPYRALERME